MKRILVSGANGNLGSAIVSHLSKSSNEILIASSRPGKDSHLLDFNQDTFFNFKNVDLLIHVARAKNLSALKNEENFLKYMFSSGAKVVSIGSLSEYLLDKSEYGEFKSRVSELVLESNGVVLTCGLIYGENFEGQLYKIENALQLLPFLPQFKVDLFQYTTNLSSLLHVLDLAISNSLIERNILVADSKTPTNFNAILANLGKKSYQKIFIPIKLVNLGALVSEKMNLKYFNRDSLKGLLGKYDYSRIEKLKFFINSS